MSKLEAKFRKVDWKFFGKIGYLLLFAVLAATALVVVSSALDIPKGIRLYTVQTGSMSPKIPAGSVVVIKPLNDYKKGDVVTFKSESERENNKPKHTTTHRIYEVHETADGLQYETKGDFNPSPDGNFVKKDLILGRVIFNIPLLGYPVSFAKTQVGFILLIVIPATIIVYSELLNIKKELAKILKERKEKKK